MGGSGESFDVVGFILLLKTKKEENFGPLGLRTKWPSAQKSLLRGGKEEKGGQKWHGNGWQGNRRCDFVCSQ